MKASEQLRGWAIDRAIELQKANNGTSRSAEEIVSDAKILCDFCFDPEELARMDEEDKLRAEEIKAESVQ